MNPHRRPTRACLAFFLLVALPPLMSADETAPRRLRVGIISSGYQPVAHHDFSAALAREVLTRLGEPFDLEASVTGGIKALAALRDRRLDLLAMQARTPSRATAYAFSVPHTRFSIATIIRREDASRFSTLESLRGGVADVDPQGFYWELGRQSGYFARHLAETEEVEYCANLLAKRADYVPRTRIDILNTLQTLNLADQLTAGPLLPGIYAEFCFASQKENQELINRINDVLFQIKQDGTYARIYEEHFGILEHPLDRSTVYRWIARAGGLVVVTIALFYGLHRWRLRQIKVREAHLSREVARRTDELRASEERLRLLSEAIPGGVSLLRPAPDFSHWHIVDCTEKFAAMHGYTRAELIGKSGRLVHCPKGSDRSNSDVKTVWEGEPRTGRGHHRRKDGFTFPVAYVNEFAIWNGVRCLISLDRDITAEVETESKLRHLDKLYQMVMEATGDAVFEHDLATGITRCNHQGALLLGLDSAGYQPSLTNWTTRVHPDDRQGWDEAILRWRETPPQPFAHHARFQHTDGTWRWLAWRASTSIDPAGKPERVVGAIRDITSLKEMELAQSRSQKLVAVGQMAAGIAHEFNNLLTPMRVQVAVLDSSLPAGSSLRTELVPLAQAIEDAAKLTQRILAFGRRPTEATQPLPLHETMEDAISLIRSSLDPRIQLETSLIPAWAAFGKTDLHQIVVNLVLNARDTLVERLAAPPPGWSARLRVALSLRPCSATAPDSCCATLLFEDNGMGLSAAQKEKIFEPFYTTKSQGNGLGLAIVWQLIRASAGSISVRSEPNIGTTFEILLPAVLPPAVALVAASEPSALPTAPRPARLLLIEDTVIVSDVCRLLFIKLGYTVEVFADGRQADEHLNRHPDDYHAIITDNNLPGISGLELARRHRARSRSSRIILMSGSCSSFTPEILRDHGVDHLIAKPFDRHELARVICSVS